MKHSPVAPHQTAADSPESRDVTVEVWKPDAQAGQGAALIDHIAAETAVALVYNGISHVVMMATPVQLEEFAIGFSLSEGIIDSREEVYDIQLHSRDQGIEVEMTVASRCFERLKDRRRNLSGRTGCGICGAESLQQSRLPVAPVVADIKVSHTAINRAVENLSAHQPVQSLTGGVHAAAWCDVQGQVQILREDIGRHNALDKLIGARALDESVQSEGFLLISSRASYEMVQKAAMAGIAILVAVSAPTSLALTIAEQAGISLVGFARSNRHVVYCHGSRLG